MNLKPVLLCLIDGELSACSRKSQIPYQKVVPDKKRPIGLQEEVL